MVSPSSWTFAPLSIEMPAPYPFLRLVSSDGDEMVGVFDINGDGLPDQVVGCDRERHRDCPVGAFGGPLWEVYLNTGHAMQTVPDLWTFGTTGGMKAGIRRIQSQRVVRDLFDINGDGLPDVVEVRADNNWNVYLNGAAGSPFQMGGCQGCHGFQGQFQGGDMSRLIAAAPGNSWQAESITASAATSIRTHFHRSRHVSIPDGGEIPDGVTPRHFKRGTPAPPTP